MRTLTIVLAGTIGLIWVAAALGGDNAAAPADRAAKKAAREAAAKERREKAQENREKAKQARTKAKTEHDKKSHLTREQREAHRGKNVDHREARQDRRIDHGVKNGSLTSDELAKLEAQQKSIADLETSLKADDGKLSKDEFKQITEALNTASRSIWAEKHDTEGKQMPTYRLGKDVFAKSGFTAQMADENLSPDAAKALMKDFRRTVQLRHQLASKDLPADERSKLQTEYNDLLNKYWEIRPPSSQPDAK